MTVDLTTVKLSTADIKAELDRRRYNKREQYFPDAGPFRRELYPKHIDFLKATASFREICFMAGNRCITPWTYLSSNRLALSTVCAPSFDVRSWDGEKECNAQGQEGFVKGILPAFRVVLDNNQFFDCTGEHRVLTSEGYLELSQLMSRANGLRLLRKREDYQASCVEDGYLCDPQLLRESGIASRLFLGQDGVPEPSHLLHWPVDGEDNILKYNHSYLEHDRLSTQDDLGRHADLFSKFLSAFVGTSVLPLSESTHKFLQFVNELALELQSYPATDGPRIISSFLSGIGDHFGAPTVQRCPELDLEFPVFPLHFCPSLPIEKFLHDDHRIALFFPFSHTPLVGGRTIKAVVPIGLQPIIDFHVPRHKNYLAAGVFHHNTGKSEAVCFAAMVFATGNYPSWWEGKFFNRPTNILVAGETGKLVRDSIQMKLLGPPSDIGSGMIPKELIVDYRPKAGIPDAIDTVRIKHVSGRESIIQFQSYDQGREAFQATERDVIIEDEEPPESIHSECLIRTMTTGGIVMLAFTPLKGMTETVLSFQRKAEEGRACIITATWDDCGHLSEKDKDELMASLPPHQRDARSKGIPQLGSGAVFPIAEEDIICDPFEIPKHYSRGYGLDVGWNFTACMWAAYDEASDTIYLTHEYKRSQAEPAVHANAIKARGEWMPGVIDPASRGRAQADGTQLMQLYSDQGLKLTPANNAVEAGLFEMYERMTTGRLKVFKTCVKWLAEYRLYRRDEKGKIVKDNDHCMDASRYLILTKIWTPGYYEDKIRGEMQNRGKHVGDYNPYDRARLAQDFQTNQRR